MAWKSRQNMQSSSEDFIGRSCVGTRLPTAITGAAERLSMYHKMGLLSLVCGLLVCVAALRAQTPSKRAMTVDDLLAMWRISDPQISPDGHLVAYTIGTPDVGAN